MTTARYYTPDGRSIQATGIKPDIEVRPAELKELDSQPLFTEADLTGHLKGKNEDTQKQDAGKSATTDDTASLAERDYQLNSALNLLKGLRILNSGNKGNAKGSAQ